MFTCATEDCNDYAGSDMPMRIDDDGTDSIPNFPPNDHSWVAAQTDLTFATVDPNNLTGAQLPLALVRTAFGFDGNWLIRADAVPIPEPSALAILAWSVLCLILIRNR